MSINTDLYSHLTEDLGIPHAWASHMASSPKPDTFPYDSAFAALMSFDNWSFTEEGFGFWYNVLCTVSEHGVAGFDKHNLLELS